MTRPRTRIQTAALVGLLVLVVGFGIAVVHRTACLKRKTGDLDVYLRAGWAVRAGVNPYDVVCDNHWHYSYPPPYALLLAPLADPPVRDAATTAARMLGSLTSPAAGPLQAAVSVAVCENPLPPDVGWCVPFVISAGLYYVLGVLACFAGVHILALALERGKPVDAERWWALRLAPLFICLVPLGQTLVRGQVGTFLLLLLAGLLAGLSAGRPLRAGLYLAGAIALKIIPAYLLLLPIWLRGRRCLLGVTVGLVVLLGLLPLTVLGPVRTFACYERLTESTLAPALRLGGDSSRARELIQTGATDTQSFGAVLHNCLYPDRATRPREAEPWTRRVHWAIAGLLLLVTMLAAWRGGVATPARRVLLGGALTTLMLLTSPVCHLHYLMLLMPLWMGLLVVHWDRQGWQGEPVSWGRHFAHAGFALGLLIPTLPGMESTRDLGLALWLALFAWARACVELGTRPSDHRGFVQVSDQARQQVDAALPKRSCRTTFPSAA